MSRAHTLPDVSSRYGAPMGRRGYHEPLDATQPIRFYLRRVPLDSGGYDAGGAYWGHGAPLWHYYSPAGTVDAFTRAASRDAAKNIILMTYTAATFFR